MQFTLIRPRPLNFHLGLLAGVFWMVTRAGFVNRQLGLLLGIAFVLFYCWLTGGRPPILRATILVTVLCLAELSFRPALPVNVLATAAVLVLAIDPSSLFQAGTQLSFVAVLGLLRCHGLFAVPSEPHRCRQPVLWWGYCQTHTTYTG